MMWPRLTEWETEALDGKPPAWGHTGASDWSQIRTDLKRNGNLFSWVTEKFRTIAQLDPEAQFFPLFWLHSYASDRQSAPQNLQAYIPPI